MRFIDSARRQARFVLAIMVALILCAVLARVFAHGSAQWIADGGYVGNDLIGCCGPSDCQPVPCETITRVPGGYEWEGVRFPDDERGTYRNGHDDLCWSCVHGAAPACLFVRPEGT